MQRILILLQSGIGDLIMALPLLKMCRANLYDQDRLLILTESPNTKSIIERAININEKIEINCISDIWSGSKYNVLKYALILRSFHPTLFLLPHATNRLSITLFSIIVSARKAVLPYSKINALFFDTVKNRYPEHKVSYYMRYGAYCDLNYNNMPTVSFDVSGLDLTGLKEVAADMKTDRCWIGFAPGSGTAEAHKRWPVCSYIILGKMILDSNPKYSIAIFGSPAERVIVEEIKSNLKSFSDRVILIVNPNIMITAAVMKHCACLISACSGLMHLAVAMDIPIVGLYGPTNPGFTGPFSDKARILRIGLDCSPCYRLGFNKGCGNPICMSMIKPSAVFKEVMLVLNNQFMSKIPWYSTTCAVKPDIHIE